MSTIVHKDYCPECHGSGMSDQQPPGNDVEFIIGTCPRCNGEGFVTVTVCRVNDFMSCICDRGTKGCTVNHQAEQKSGIIFET